MFVFAPKWMKLNTSASAELANEVSVTRGHFVSFLFFASFWLPYSLIVLIDYGDLLPKNALMVSMAIAHFNSALNPFIYGVFNPDFRRGYSNLLKRFFKSDQLYKLNKIRPDCVKKSNSYIKHNSNEEKM